MAKEGTVNTDLVIPAEPEKKTNGSAPKSKWKYIGPPLRKGLYLPNGIMIHPDRIADADLDIYMAQFPEALAPFFKLA